MITAAEFESRMKSIAESDATSEIKEKEGTKLVCKVLKSLGYDAGAKIYKDLRK